MFVYVFLIFKCVDTNYLIAKYTFYRKNSPVDIQQNQEISIQVKHDVNYSSQSETVIRSQRFHCCVLSTRVSLSCVSSRGQIHDVLLTQMIHILSLINCVYNLFKFPLVGLWLKQTVQVTNAPQQLNWGKAKYIFTLLGNIDIVQW